MPVIETHKLTPESISALGGHVTHQIYNGLDCCVTSEVHEALLSLGPAPQMYDFERGIQAPLLEMMTRGFKVDQFERQKGIAMLRKQVEYLDGVYDDKKRLIKAGLLQRYAEAVWDRPLNPQSPKQLIEFFYRTMNLPEQWVSRKGVKKLSTDRETLEKLELYFHAMPIIAVILAIRDAKKKLSVLETEIDLDGRMRTSYNIGGTETWRLSSSSSAEGTGCVLPSTEVLTEQGWRRIDSIAKGTRIAQWEQGGKISFVACGMYSTEFAGEMLRVKTEQVQQTLTPAHRVPYIDSRLSGLRVDRADNVAELSQCVLPLGGRTADGTLAYPAYLSMLMADFSKEDSGWRGAFKKSRKITRFLKLAEFFGLAYTEQKGKDGYRRFYIPGHLDLPKAWGEWVLNLSQATAEALLEEARHWDSHDRNSGFIFFTADKAQAEWFAVLAHIAGRAATIRQQEQNPGSYSTTTMWCVNVKSRNHARVQRKHWTKVAYVGKVYCPQVPSSFWLMREDGFISVTGNTNLQNITAELRKMFVADEGWKLCGIDLEQAESREVGWQCGVLFDDWSYLDACYGGDLHTTVCRMNWKSLPWTGDNKKDKAIAEQPAYRHLSYRDLAKKLGHGSNYFGQPWTMARHAKVLPRMVEDFQRAYFESFPGIPKWHRHCAQSIQTTHTITNAWGAVRHFFGRPNDDSTLREAIAFGPQSSTAIRMNLGLYRLWRELGTTIRLLAQVHDAVYFLYPPHLEDEIIPKALSLIDVRLKHKGRELIVPGEAKVGWNWGNFDKDKNPNGLAKWKGPGSDKRQRVGGLDRVL